MTAAQLERLQEYLRRLRLFKSRERLEALLQEATTKELSYADFLDQVLTEEVTAKTSKNVTMRTSLARFPFVKSLDNFDFSYQPSVDRKQIQTLSPATLSNMGRMSFSSVHRASAKRTWRRASGYGPSSTATGCSLRRPPR